MSSPLLNFDPRPGNPHNHFLYDVIYAYFSSNYYSSNDASGCFSSTNVWPRGLDRPEHLTHAILDNILIERLTNLRAECNFRSPDWEQEIMEVYIRNVEKSIILARTFGIRIMCALEPLLIFKEKLTDREKSALPGPEAMQYIERQYYLIGQRYDELSMKYRNDSGVIVLNMHDLFRKNEEEIFKDIIHYNDLGSEIISDAIRRRIALWLNPS